MARPRLTRRCEEDLEALPVAVADDLLRKFLTGRAAAPEVGERVLGSHTRTCYSLHSGRYRAATWYDREQDIVWLIAAGVHRDDSREDFYEEAARLERAGWLYPIESDYAIGEVMEEETRLRREASDLRRLREQAVASPSSPRLLYTSPDGLYAEVWAEAVPGLALLALRVRIARLAGPFLSGAEWAIILRGPLGRSAEEKADPDGDRWFRYFEEYVEL